MKDMQVHLETLRGNIAECERLGLTAKSAINAASSKDWQITTKFLPQSLSER
jgi:hypothetical protein